MQIMDNKQLELNAILEITQAINKNIGEEDLYQIFFNTCMSKLEFPQFAFVIEEHGEYLTILDKAFNPKLKHAEGVVQIIQKTNAKIIKLDKQKGFEKAGVVMPIRHKERVLGMIFIGKEKLDNYTQNDLHFVKTLGNIIMMAVENKRLARKEIKQERLKKEMEIAREVQSYLVPDVLPKNDKITMVSSYVPHYSVGGDLFRLYSVR